MRMPSPAPAITISKKSVYVYKTRKNARPTDVSAVNTKKVVTTMPGALSNLFALIPTYNRNWLTAISAINTRISLSIVEWGSLNLYTLQKARNPVDTKKNQLMYHLSMTKSTYRVSDDKGSVLEIIRVYSQLGLFYPSCPDLSAYILKFYLSYNIKL